MMNRTTEKKRNILVFALIAAGAFFLRQWNIGLTSFGMDEGIACIYAARIWKMGEIPLVGVKTSLHFYNPPLLVYLLSPLLLIQSNPIFPLEFLIFVQITGALLLARLLARHFTPSAVAVFLFAYALMPVMIFTSRRLWGHSFVAASSLFYLYFLIMWSIEKKEKAVIGVLIAALFAQQFHLSGILMIVHTAIVYFLFRPPLRLKYIIIGVFGGGWSYLPYLLFLLKSKFSDIRIVFSLFGDATSTKVSFPAPLTSGLLMMGDAGRNDLVPPLTSHPSQTPFFFIVNLLMGLLLFAGMGYVCVHVLKRGRKKDSEARSNTEIALISSIGILLCIIFFLVVRVSFVPFYLLPSIAGFPVIAGWLFHRVEKRKLVQLFLLLFLLVWGCTQVAYIAKTNHALANAQPGDDVHTVYLWKKVTAVALRERAFDRPPTLIIQNQNPPSKGVDYGLAYLIWWETQNPTLLTKSTDDFQTLVILIDVRESRPAFQIARELLSPFEYGSAGNIQIYILERTQVTPQIADAFL